VFLVDLLVDGQLLLVLVQLGLEAGLLEICRLLVGVDDLGSYELVERLSLMLRNNVIDLGGIGLEQQLALAESGTSLDSSD